MLAFNRDNRKNRRFVWNKKSVRWPGIEPGSNAWKASMLTITPPTLGVKLKLKELSTKETSFFSVTVNSRFDKFEKNK